MTNTLILGATSAIAHETAKLFVARGDRLFLVGRNEARLQSVTADLAVRGGYELGSMAVDLNEMDRHQEILAGATTFLNGYERVLIAYGTLGDQKQNERDPREAEHQLRTNFLSAVSLLTLIAEELEEKKKGTIAVISSVAGDRGRQSNYVYSAAKGGLSIFLQGLRNRLHPAEVHVLTIKPGFVRTPMTAHLKQGPLFAEPKTIAAGIVRAMDKRKDVVYLPSWWRLVMWIIRTIPESIFKKLKL